MAAKKSANTSARDASIRQADLYLAIERRDRGRCRVCCRIAWLHRHHIIYRSRGGADTSDNLISVCRECHADIHGGTLKLHGDADRRDDDGLLCGVDVLRLDASGEWVAVRTV